MRPSRLFVAVLAALALLGAVPTLAVAAPLKYGVYFAVKGGLSFRLDRGLATVSQANATCTIQDGSTGSIVIHPRLRISHGAFGYNGRVTLNLVAGKRTVKVAFKGRFSGARAVGSLSWANTGNVTCAPIRFSARWIGVNPMG